MQSFSGKWGPTRLCPSGLRDPGERPFPVVTMGPSDAQWEGSEQCLVTFSQLLTPVISDCATPLPPPDHFPFHWKVLGLEDSQTDLAVSLSLTEACPMEPSIHVQGLLNALSSVGFWLCLWCHIHLSTVTTISSWDERKAKTCLQSGEPAPAFRGASKVSRALDLWVPLQVRRKPWMRTSKRNQPCIQAIAGASQVS